MTTCYSYCYHYHYFADEDSEAQRGAGLVRSPAAACPESAAAASTWAPLVLRQTPLRAPASITTSRTCYPDFTEEETEAQQPGEIHPRPQGWEVGSCQLCQVGGAPAFSVRSRDWTLERTPAASSRPPQVGSGTSTSTQEAAPQAPPTAHGPPTVCIWVCPATWLCPGGSGLHVLWSGDRCPGQRPGEHSEAQVGRASSVCPGLRWLSNGLGKRPVFHHMDHMWGFLLTLLLCKIFPRPLP